MKIFTLPDLGEGLPDAEIVNWHVAVGDLVKLDQILVSVETAKAVVEVPSPIEGIIQKLFANAGDIVHTGAPLVEFDLGDQSTLKVTPENVGLANSSSDRRNNAATAAGELEIGDTVIQQHSPQQNIHKGVSLSSPGHPIKSSIKATPAIRALAQQLQVDLGNVIATGPQGIITKQDVEKAAEAILAAGPYEPLRGIRRAMAYSMRKAYDEVVPITVVDDAKLLHWPATEDVTVRIIQAIIEAYKKEPDINVWFDSKIMARRTIPELHLGIAMDTKDGLFVPVIHNADAKNKSELRTALDLLKKQVSDRTIAPQDLQGATFTLSNFGVFAGRYANPVIIPPTVAILGTGKMREEVVAVKGEMKICKVLPLSLTFDHRVLTGGEATRFLAAVLQSLEAA